MTPATPSLPFAPTPVGNETWVALPTFARHGALTCVRKSVKTYVSPLPSLR